MTEWHDVCTQYRRIEREIPPFEIQGEDLECRRDGEHLKCVTAGADLSNTRNRVNHSLVIYQ